MTILNDTWILDIPSQTWRQYRSYTDHTRICHTGTVTDNGCAVITGGVITCTKDSYKDYSISFLIMLEPRSLQQLAMQMILKHTAELPWQYLPNKLIALLGISESDERTIEESQTSTNYLCCPRYDVKQKLTFEELLFLQVIHYYSLYSHTRIHRQALFFTTNCHCNVWNKIKYTLKVFWRGTSTFVIINSDINLFIIHCIYYESSLCMH